MKLVAFVTRYVNRLYDHASFYKQGTVSITEQFIEENFPGAEFYHFYIDRVKSILAIRFSDTQDIDGLLTGKRLPAVKSGNRRSFSVQGVFREFNIRLNDSVSMKCKVKDDYVIFNLNALRVKPTKGKKS